MRASTLPLAQMRNSPSETRDGPRLSQRLRTETRSLHTAAERAGVMRALARGELSLQRYTALLQSLAAIYEALETQLDRHQGHPAISWLDRDALRRLPSIEQDLAALDGSRLSAAGPSRTAKEYVDRLPRVGDARPELLLAHAYVRYLGDLSGGQILAPIVARSYGGSGRHVTHFYEFPRIKDVAAFKLSFRDGLDRVANILADEVVQEALTAFRLHERLFRELEQPSR